MMYLLIYLIKRDKCIDRFAVQSNSISQKRSIAIIRRCLRNKGVTSIICYIDIYDIIFFYTFSRLSFSPVNDYRR